MKYLYLSILTIIMLTCSCTSKIKLSDTEALKILKEDYKKYCFIQVNDETNSFTSNKPTLAIFRELEAQGLVTVSQEQLYIHGRPSTIRYTWKPTEKGKQYKSKSTSKYKMTELVIKDLIGVSISQEDKTAIVRFSYGYIYTPFKKVQSRRIGGCKENSGEHELEFIQYDTGWKIKT